MTIGRRAFVTALAGATVAGLQVGPAAAGMPQMLVPADPVLLLVDASASPAIRTGAGRALAASGLSLVQRVADDECRVLAGSVAWLAARPGRRMLGLLRDADAVLLEQMAWDCGLSPACPRPSTARAPRQKCNPAIASPRSPPMPASATRWPANSRRPGWTSPSSPIGWPCRTPRCRPARCRQSPRPALAGKPRWAGCWPRSRREAGPVAHRTWPGYSPAARAPRLNPTP